MGVLSTARAQNRTAGRAGAGGVQSINAEGTASAAGVVVVMAAVGGWRGRGNGRVAGTGDGEDGRCEGGGEAGSTGVASTGIAPAGEWRDGS